MLNINKVYFDMDGVLADFDRELETITGKTISEIRSMPFEDAEELVVGLISSNPEFFANLQPTRYFEGMVDFMKYLVDQGVEVNILTSMGRDFYKDFDATTHKAKSEWLEKYGLSEIVSNMCTVPKCCMKQYYAEPNSMLIDDKKSNCQEFSAKGGVSINVDLGWEQFDVTKVFESAKEYMTFTS